MNYFDLHIGDYEKATAHLTACEDGIYGRLMRRYYDTEAPLQDDLKAIQRFVRARSREEKEAVQTILDEFFDLQSDGWHHKRCDEEIARFIEKREKAKRSANARWSHSERSANASTNAMRTHSECNAHHTPSTKHQTPEELGETEAHTNGTPGDEPPGSGVCDPSPVVLASIALRKLGLRTTPQHPDLIAAIDEGVTVEALTEMARSYPGKPAGYVISACRRQRAEGAQPIAPGANHGHANGGTGRKLSAVEQVQQAILERRSRQPDGEDAALQLGHG